MARSLCLLAAANVFMTFAWYGHLKFLSHRPLWIAVMVSWGIAFFEYCLQVPANRMGSAYFTLAQLKILQEVMTLVIFSGFAVWYMEIRMTWNYLWAGLCMLGAVFFIFRDGFSAGGSP